MKRLLIVCIILALGSVSCKKDAEKPADTSQPSEKQDVALGKRYAALAISIRTEQDLKSKASAFLSKTEEVTLLEEIPVNVDGKEGTILKVETIDGKIGYQDAKYFGIKAIVITDNKTAAYKKNSIQSQITDTIESGTVAVITQQLGEWNEIIAYNLPDKEKEVWLKWIKEGTFSDDLAVVTDYCKIEKVKYNLLRVAVDDPNSEEKLKKNALPELEYLSENSSVKYVSDEAKRFIEYVETGYLPELDTEVTTEGGNDDSSASEDDMSEDDGEV